MTTELDNNTLEWAAQWLEGSLTGEANERVREFGKNIAMTLRAAKLPDARAPAPPPRKLYSELIHIAAELVRADGFLSPCEEDLAPKLKRADVLQTARRQEERLKDWAYRVRRVANELFSPVAATVDAETQPLRRVVGSARHPHFTHADHERMKETLDALSEYPTEEDAEAVLQACGTSGKEVVNEFIERLLKENLELKEKLTAPPSSPQPREAAMGAAEAIINYGESVRWGQHEHPMYALEIAEIIQRHCFSAESKDGQ